MTTATIIDDNLELIGSEVQCRHCHTVLGSEVEPLANALIRERDSGTGTPGIRANPGVFASLRVVSRRVTCPGCLTQLRFEVVPADEGELRHSSFSTAAEH
jgi:hypothetical protein